jgi:hypothetical protein
MSGFRRNFRLRKDKHSYEFKKIGTVLIIQVPVYKLPPSKAEEHLSKVKNCFMLVKDELNVTNIMVVGKWEA